MYLLIIFLSIIGSSFAGGILAMLVSLLVLFIIPFISTSDVRNTTYRPLLKVFFWLFIVYFVILPWVGQKPVKDYFILTGQIATFYYFLFFIVLIPVIGKVESILVHHKSE
jgi:ubiquinol-cytochrome c reductase cytochrome b subunit